MAISLIWKMSYLILRLSQINMIELSMVKIGAMFSAGVVTVH